MSLVCWAVGVFLLGACVSPCLGGRRLARVAGPTLAVFGAALGLAGLILAGPGEAAWHLPVTLVFGALDLRLDALSRVFLIPVFLLVPLGALYGARYLAPDASGNAHAGHDSHSPNLGAHWGFVNLLAAGMTLVPLAADGFLFLVCWELMSLAPFFLVSFHDDKAEVREASWVYLVAAHLGALALLALVALLARESGSFSFAVWRTVAPSPALANGLFLLAVLGFGAKAGLVPLHVWLPEAHPAAPSHVSALMSGALVNAGIYGLCRVLSFLGPLQPWWGPVLLGLGLVTALYGILAALAQRDLKRLLALSTVENMGIAILGLGAGLTALAAGHPAAAFLGFAGALLHVLNHAVFKGLLFLGAGTVLKATGTASLDLLGGLAKRMPKTALCWITGAAAISGLPPFNGFVGEMTIYLSLAKGLELSAVSGRLALLVGFVGLAAVGGLVLAGFARAYGAVFLGHPRSEAVANAADPAPGMLGPMVLLAGLCLAGGLGGPLVLRLVTPAVAGLLGSAWAGPAMAGEAVTILWAVSLTGGVLMAMVVGVALFRRWRVGRGPAAGLADRADRADRAGQTWGCGFAAPTPRMQYTPGSLAAPLVKLFGPFSGQRSRFFEPRGYFPAGSVLSTETPDLARERLLGPLFEAVARASDGLKWLQHGRAHLYVLYILATLLTLLVWELG